MHTHVLIVDDHSIVRTGLRLMLELKTGICHSDIQECGNCHEMLAKLRSESFSHIFLDVTLPDGNALEMIPSIKKLYPQTEIFILTMQPLEMYSKILASFGIRYYVSKSLPEDEMLPVIKNFFQSDTTTSSASGGAVLEKNIFVDLTSREMQVLHHMLNGMDTKAISEILSLQKNTVSTHKKKIFEKTNTRNLKQLMELATVYDTNSKKLYSNEAL